MGVAEVVHPMDCVACADAVVPRAAWVDGKREELARLAAELRTIQSRRDEPRSPGWSAPAEAASPASIVPMVETMLLEAMERLDAAAAEARARMDEAVAGAVIGADQLQRSAEEVEASLRWNHGARSEWEASRPAAHLRIEPDLDQSTEWHEADWVAPAAWDELDTACLGPRLDDAGSVLDLRDDAHVNDAFWRDAMVAPPVRERLRRWVQGETS